MVGDRGDLTAFDLIRAKPEDAEAVSDLYLASRAAMMPDLRPVHDDTATRRWIACCMIPDLEVWLAREAESRSIVGILALDGDFIDQLYVHPDRFRQGIGRGLIEHAKRCRPEGLSLYCFSRNSSARRFYEAMAFELVLERDGRSNEEGEPDCLYRWRRSP